ncbi:hypothetical protein BURPS1106B_A3679 [Burkholderia pseudomallei 1106b]|uniref:Uncharacterized protein n=2 Tax=Burkholderia pseudomallei TaxID=28450 RepID=A0A0E1W3D3_BURPE|nr:hypothetical protein BURPS668_0377 [Burkholderia pseudomallei 668]ABN89238.1 hypothetical protein BURPS1106A_0396 [Burkholderia pseudomallei 1106a]ACQ98961.1 conserved hypothetical protein [Burkholderia pseudomallei MSHR346]AFR14272.1 hypothetical protein BPC006_I0382 [Burkholderia pseudomallei BPC006]EDU09622.1 hypothetical protein BURPS1655_K0981 [Burkholderia pseudomallei 1655]EEC37037.1 conserved hypothetical protein [Burkholderia pseudomallei 576]EEH23645.1 conserved hypothetical prot
MCWSPLRHRRAPESAPLCFDAQRNELYFFTPIEEFFCLS